MKGLLYPYYGRKAGVTRMHLGRGAPGRAPLVSLALLMVIGLAGCRSAGGAPGELRPGVRALAPGLQHEVRVDPRGPWRLHIVQLDLQHPALSLDVVRANDALRGRERPTAMVKRTHSDTSRVRVALNADFFDLQTGENENNQVLRGEWWKGLPLTESPYDTYNNVHSQVAVDATGGVTFGRFILDARAWSRSAAVPVLHINSRPLGRYEGTALYTPRFGPNAPTDTGRVAELRLRPIGVRGDTTLYAASDTASSRSGNAIPRDGVLLVGYGDRAAGVASLSRTDTVRVHFNTWPRLASQRPPQLLLGGWPRLLEAGESVAARAALLEGTISRNAEARHPRSAIGVSQSGQTAWLVTVDGRSAASVGMTLVELAEFLRSLGAWDALNFDGGGSTAMVIDGRLVNVPSDATGEREVGNVLIVRERARR